VLAQLLEPPCTDPYARWCGRGGAERLPPIPINTHHGPGEPVIEGHVDIGAGAKILGRVRVGAHAKIGANAVVLCNVPEGGAAVGIPAKVIELN